MASAFSAPKSTLAQLTTELEDSLMSIAKMEKKGQLSKARATKARRAVQREYDDYCNAALVKNIVKKPTGGGGDGASTAPAGEEDQEGAPEAKKVKKDWPVNGSVKTLVAQEYASFEEGKKAISAAFCGQQSVHGHWKPPRGGNRPLQEEEGWPWCRQGLPRLGVQRRHARLQV